MDVPVVPPRLAGVSAAMGAVGALAGLALPAVCGGCGRLGTPWCRDCARETSRATAFPQLVAGRSGGACAPDGVVLTAAAYEGPLRSAIVAFKDGGRRDLMPVLLPVMRTVLVEALARADDPLVPVVPVPSSGRSRRERGDVPLHDLVRAALVGLDRIVDRRCVWAPVLRATRGVADQSRLTRRERADNLRGAFMVGGAPDLVRGREVVVADDIVTTGATARECVRALRVAGARPVAVVALAATTAGAVELRA